MTTVSPVKELTSPLQNSQNKCILFFWASWHDSTTPGGSTDTIFTTLAKAVQLGSSSSSNNNNNNSNNKTTVEFYRVEAEVYPVISQQYNVTVVPTFVLVNPDGSVYDTIQGMDDVPRLTQSVSTFCNSNDTSSSSSSSSPSKTNTNALQQPKLLNPQEILFQKLNSLIHTSQVMLFIKGTPTSPKCGFSRQAVTLLSQYNIPFSSFDILSDEEVRQGLKVYSDWPTYPQLYVNGELIGGLDILKEMVDGGGDLRDQLGLSSSSSSYNTNDNNNDGAVEVAVVETLQEKLQKLITRNRIMLFMKGLPSFPKCGFSRQICEILNSYSNVEYDAFNILENEEVRQGLKEYSDWPTYPQLYVDGELIGGLDIVRELHDSGELKDLLCGSSK